LAQFLASNMEAW